MGYHLVGNKNLIKNMGHKLYFLNKLFYYYIVIGEELFILHLICNYKEITQMSKKKSFEILKKSYEIRE